MTGLRLDVAQTDRAAGVLLGLASGDALGVPYEFGRPPGAEEYAAMTGGGLGDFAPGEWSDDTSMAVAVAEVAATGADLATEPALDAVAEGFLRWHRSGPADIGVQTSAVLGAAARRLTRGEAGASRVMGEEAAAYAARHAHSAGNGALMRTAPVALAHLGSRTACAEAARAVARLTHADPLAGDSCVLWCEAIRVAVLEGRIDVTAGLDLVPDERRESWAGWLADAADVERNRAERVPGERFSPNGFTVAALQAAAAAITSTEAPPEEPGAGSFACLHLQEALHAAVRIGHDTDTVAAIAGALLGARWGASAVPWRWRRAVHGWPGRDSRDLVSLGVLTVRGGRDDMKGWPSAERIRYFESASATAVPHPFDAGVLLGTHRTVDHDATAVVSVCRVGRKQPCFGAADVVVESRLMDSEEPAWNPHLAFTLHDAADAIRGLRAEGHTVLLHCVAAQQRTPSVAIAYALLLGHELETARREVKAALNDARGWGHVWEAVGRLAEAEPPHEHES